MSEQVVFTGISKIGAKNFGKDVKCRGVIVSTSKVKDVCVEACFRCSKCDSPIIVVQDGEELDKPKACTRPSCRKKSNFIFDEENSKFDDYQEIYVQELQKDISAGRLPKSVEVRMMGDLTDKFQAGDEVEVVGEVRHKKAKKDSIVFSPYLRCSTIVRMNETPEDMEISLEEETEIKKLANNPLVYETLVSSVAPHIKGWRMLKEAIVYAVFGGVHVEEQLTRKRGDINILLVGDPSTGRSELLKAITRIVPKGLYTSGKGSSAAGLTATVTKGNTGRWMLEAGALVLGDKGVVCIDEIDKMRPEDLGSIYTAMEQQIIPINKAGINTILNARNTIIAACNPAFGYYDETKSIVDNIQGKLDVVLLTRFDLIFVVRDVPDTLRDDEVSKFILGIEKNLDPNVQILVDDFFKKYIAYAKKVNPVIERGAREKLDDFYQKMRRESKTHNMVIYFTPRQLQGLMRITEAHARIRLSEVADESDADAAIKLMETSLKIIGPVEQAIKDHAVKTLEGKKQLVLNIVMSLARGKDNGVSEEDVIHAARERAYIDPTDTLKFLHVLKETDRRIYEPTVRRYKALYDIEKVFEETE